MMHKLLRDPEDWDRYLSLLVAFEGREAELEARASLLVQGNLDQGMDHAEAVRRGLDDAERVERALQSRDLAARSSPAHAREAARPGPPPRQPRPDASRREAPPRARWRPYVAAGLALAAGVLIGVIVPRGADPEHGRTWRGAPAKDAGAVALWGEALGGAEVRDHVGQGVSPVLGFRPGHIYLQWIRAPGADSLAAIAYRIDAAGARRGLSDEAQGFTRLEDPLEVDLPSGTTRLIVVAYPADQDPVQIASEALDGTISPAAGGEWQMIVYQLVEEGP